MHEVLIDVDKLSNGLKTTFLGVAMVFESIGASDAAEQIAKPNVLTAETQQCEPNAQPERNPDSESNLELCQAPQDERTEQTKDLATDTAPTITSAPINITADDITKVIVAKIKQKRSNNEKIGQLLKSYGVDKISSLPAEKYEALLTDISQL